MNRNLNRGQWEAMESYWDELLHNSEIADVSVDIKLTYPSKGGKRPESFEIVTTVTGTNGKKQSFQQSFINSCSQKNIFKKFDLSDIIS